MMLKDNKFIFSALFVAISAIIYEFLLAENLTLYVGNSVIQYNITIGLFISSMGFGALLFDVRKRDELNQFFIIEIFLGLFGGLLSFFILILNYLVFCQYLPFLLFKLFLYFSIIIIGFFVGFEIPLLIKLANKKMSYILFLDYIGSVIGTFIFSFILIGNMTIFKIGLICGFINLLIALIVANTILKKVFTLCLIFILILLMNNNFIEYMMKKFYV